MANPLSPDGEIGAQPDPRRASTSYTSLSSGWKAVNQRTGTCQAEVRTWER